MSNRSIVSSLSYCYRELCCLLFTAHTSDHVSLGLVSRCNSICIRWKLALSHVLIIRNRIVQERALLQLLEHGGRSVDIHDPDRSGSIGNRLPLAASLGSSESSVVPSGLKVGGRRVRVGGADKVGKVGGSELNRGEVVGVSKCRQSALSQYNMKDQSAK